MKRMKRIAAAVILAVCVMGAPAQNALAYEAALLPSAFQNVNAARGLSLTVIGKTHASKSMVLPLRFCNKTNRAYGFGWGFALEKCVGEQWCTLPNNAVYPALGFNLAPKSTLVETIFVTGKEGTYGDYGALESGRYRVVYELTEDEDVSKSVYLAAEFTVEEGELRAEESDYFYAKEPVNLRMGPSTEYCVLRELSLGERVLPLQKVGKWVLVRAGEETGYVYGKYLSKNEARSIVRLDKGMPK